MRLLFWIADLWPGFVQAWLAARWVGLVLAIAFAGALNLAIVTSLNWSGWLGVNSPPAASAVVAWLMVLGLWIGGAVWLRRDDPRLICGGAAGRRDPQLEAWFCEAQHEYLKGHWIEAESLIRRLLSQRPYDAEAGLLLATIQRRSLCWFEAKRTLENLKANAAAAAWTFELESEQRQIAELESESTNVSEQDNGRGERAARAA
jgi:hypothetical protein